jgi:glycosyltransferase involved in cell wall biosynthesis
LARLQAYRQLARRFRDIAPTLPKPNVIVAAIPSLDWAEAAVGFGQQHHIPVVVDVRDLWPDVYTNAVPAWCRSISTRILRPLFDQCRRICRGATAITGVSQSYVDWGVHRANRSATVLDRPYAIGYEAPVSTLGHAADRCQKHGIDPRKTICLFAGLFESTYDVSAVVDAARRLSHRTDVQFVVAGRGRQLDIARSQVQDLTNVVFAGWLDRHDLMAIAEASAIGLCAYAQDATQSLPNKPFEYMASKLAIVSSLSGELATLIDRHGCGINYRAGDSAALANAIAKLADDKSLLCQQQHAAFELWNQSFRYQTIYPAFADYLEQCANTASHCQAMPQAA